MLWRRNGSPAPEILNTQTAEAELWDPALGPRRLDQEALAKDLGIDPSCVGIKWTLSIVASAVECDIASRSRGNGLVSTAVLEQARLAIKLHKKDLGHYKPWALDADSDPVDRQYKAAEVGLGLIRANIESIYAETARPLAEAA